MSTPYGPQLSPHSTRSYSIFKALPLKIRSMIYKYTFEMCGPKFLRVCKQVHWEAMQYTFPSLCLHLTEKALRCDFIKGPRFVGLIFDRIVNLHIDLDLRKVRYDELCILDQDVNVMTPFTRYRDRQFFVISLRNVDSRDFAIDLTMQRRFRMNTVDMLLTHLFSVEGFCKVVLEVSCNGTGAAYRKDLEICVSENVPELWGNTISHDGDKEEVITLEWYPPECAVHVTYQHERKRFKPGRPAVLQKHDYEVEFDEDMDGSETSVEEVVESSDEEDDESSDEDVTRLSEEDDESSDEDVTRSSDEENTESSDEDESSD